MCRIRCLMISTAVLVVLGTAMAAQVVQANAPREHDTGFFLRLSAGGGSARTETQEEGVNIEAFGVAGDANFAIGAVVSPNLAVHGSFFGWSVTDPDLEFNGIKFDTQDISMTMSAFGAGVTYYLAPSNVYLTGSIGVATLTLDYKDGGTTVSVESKTGFAGEAAVGKEWWVGDKWGLGVAGDVNYHSIPNDVEAADNLSGVGFGIRFSATHN